MPQHSIDNPAGAFGQTATALGQIVYWAVNNSGGTLTTGDVVVSLPSASLVTTTTTASDQLVCGVVGWKQYSNLSQGLETFAAGAIVPVVVYGPARIQIAANTVPARAVLSTSAVAKVAAVAANAASVAALQALVGSFVATALEAEAAKDASSTIRCWVFKG